MRNLKVYLWFLLSSCFVAISMAQAHWNILSTSNTPIKSNTFYTLQAVTDKSHLIYKETKYGINLGWSKRKKPEFQFMKEGGGKIKCGDKVALFNIRHGYIKYEYREYGIELKWSQTPVLEWEIRNKDNIKGSPILPNTPIGLYNSVSNDFIRKYHRTGTSVVDLAWVLEGPDGYRQPDKFSDIPYNEGTRDEIVNYLSKMLIEKKPK